MNATPYHSRKRNLITAGVFLALFAGSIPLQAQTRAYWNFEEGTAGSNVDRGGQADGTFYGSVLDQSGNGYHLSTWSDGGYAGYVYRDDVAGPMILPADAPNNLCVKNTGGFPMMWTESGTSLQTWEPGAWTVEATFKLEHGSYRTIVGRDSEGSVTTGDPDLPALSFGAVPNNALTIGFSDVQGYWHEAVSAQDIFTSFDFPTDPDGDLAPWYSMAATSDGSTLSLYLRNVTASGLWSLIAQTDMTLSGSPDTTLTSGTGDGDDWDAGNFSVGRGLFAGGHADRAWGFIDEVRLTDGVLSTGQFLFLSVPEPNSLLLFFLGALGVAALRRWPRQHLSAGAPRRALGS